MLLTGYHLKNIWILEEKRFSFSTSKAMVIAQTPCMCLVCCSSYMISCIGDVQPFFILEQHRTMGAAGFGGSFAPIVQYEKWEIYKVFPHFPYFRLGQNLTPNLLVPLCGAALDFPLKKFRFLGAQSF